MTTPTIGIACHSFRTDGGMGRYVQLLAEGLLNLGIHPTVITKKIDYSLPLSKEVSFHHIGSSSKALFNFALRELLSITQAKFLCKRLFRVLLKSFP